MATWTFRTPSVDEGPASWDDPLFLRVKLARGISILEGPPGTYRAARFPTQDEIAASAPGMYMGGHEYVWTTPRRPRSSRPASASPDSNFTTAGSYGAGAYGSGPYGG
jgi:hypothetical protein